MRCDILHLSSLAQKESRDIGQLTKKRMAKAMEPLLKAYRLLSDCFLLVCVFGSIADICSE